MKYLIAIAAVLASMLGAASPARAQPAGRPSPGLAQELARSTDYRAFVLQVKDRPLEGGAYYADYVLDECGRDFKAIAALGRQALAAQIQATGTVPAWQLEMSQVLANRCAGFAPGEVAQLLTALKPSLALDPFMSAQVALLAAMHSRSRSAMKHAFATLLEIDDPMLWTHHQLHQIAANATGTGLYLDGTFYTDADGARALEASVALDLGFCKPGLPCGPDFVLQVVCASGGQCAPDRVEQARQYFLANGGDPAGWQRTLALAARVRAALDRKDISFFIR